MDGTAWSAPAAARTAAARAPRLLVTGHFVFAGQVGGAEHMFYNLVRGLGAAGEAPLVLCADERNFDPDFVAELPPGQVLACGGGSGSRFVGEQRAALRRGLAAEAVLFPNYFVPPIVPGRLGRVATVIHDVQFRHFPQHFSARKRAWLTASQALAMRRADTVVAISDFVRDDLLRVYGRRFAGKVVTIPNPISWDRFGPADDGGPPLDRPYILSVAAQYAHKNLPVLVRAFAEAARRQSDLALVLCGQPYDSLRGVPGSREGLGTLIAELGLHGRVQMTGYVDDLALGRWYRHAAMFAFPSVFEGFGMPPVEALGFGLPTITTACTALPETTMGLAVTVQDPSSAAEWADRLLQVWRNPAPARPGPAAVARLRAHYSPAVIGQQYARACLP